MGAFMVRLQPDGATPDRVNVTVFESAGFPSLIPLARPIAALQDLLPGDFADAHTLLGFRPSFYGWHDVFHHFQATLIAPRTYGVSMEATQIGKPLVPVLWDLAGFWVFGHFLEHLPGGHFADVVQEKRLNPLEDGFLMIFANFGIFV